MVGSIDLEPMAWHWTWEHNGAPQVNSRFEKLTGGRHMDSADWAAWIAVKMVIKSRKARVRRISRSNVTSCSTGPYSMVTRAWR